MTQKKYYVGKITSIKDSIAHCLNSPSSAPFVGEVVEISCSNGLFKGVVFESTYSYLKILLLVNCQEKIKIGDSIYGSYKELRIKVGSSILNKVLSPFSDVLIEKENNNNLNSLLENLFEAEYKEMTNESPSIINRKKVSKPFLTGVNSIDCLFPIGLGQRQLLIGDNNTGKTSLAVSSILNQKRFNKFSKIRYNSYTKLTYFKPCIYVSIGQKRSEAIRIKEVLNSFDSLWYTSIIFSSSDDLPVIQYYAPYAGCIIAEYFMSCGYDAILVFDDLSKHSVAYRQITLLLRRPPGREAFPGDVFFLHSRLLERSAQLSSNKGEGSMTSLPIVETLCGDVSSYIPTNVISITDGQIFLNKDLLNRGILPAVDLNLSVSRVGSSSQYKWMVSVSKLIKTQISLYRQFKDAELLGGGSNVKVKNYVNRGKRLTLVFTQPLYSSKKFVKQVLYLYLLGAGFADQMDLRLTKFFLGSVFNTEFYSHLPSKYSILYLDFFRSLSTLEENISIFSFEVFSSKLHTLFFAFTNFFEGIILPIITNFKDQSYIWSLVSNYNDSF